MKLSLLNTFLKTQKIKMGMIAAIIYLLPHGVFAQCNTNIPVPVNGTRCGPGQVQLSATAPGTNTINWYQQSTGGVPLGSGNTFTTPFIPFTSNFYANV